MGHFSTKWKCIICASCRAAAAIPKSYVTGPACVVWYFWSVSVLGILFLLTVQLALKNFLFYPLHAILLNIATLGQLLSMKVMDPIPPLKELNKILSVALRRGELIETPTSSAWLLRRERVIKEFTRDLFQKRCLPKEISPLWTLDVTEVSSLLSLLSLPMLEQPISSSLSNVPERALQR